MMFFAQQNYKSILGYTYFKLGVFYTMVKSEIENATMNLSVRYNIDSSRRTHETDYQFNLSLQLCFERQNIHTRRYDETT